MRWLALLLVVASTADAQPRFQRFTQRTPQGRNTRGLLSDSYAFFEFAPADGAGMPAACSTTAPTGAKGETMTFARASGAVCTKTAAGGLVTSGIADGDLVELSSNVARVEYDSGGVKGLRVEGSGQNVLTRFIDYANAAWSDVGTPTLTGSQASPFAGTYATSAVQFDDNDGAAFEGRSIPVAVSAGSAYIAHCYVKGGTATSARIVLDGTAATITGLSATTWSIVEVGDASASAASITLEVDVGSTAAATGTVTFGGCDVKLGTYRTSIVPTGAAAVTRAVELPSFTHASIATTFPAGGTFSMSAYVQTLFAVCTGGNAAVELDNTSGSGSPPALAYCNAGFAQGYSLSGGLLSTGAAWGSGLHKLSYDSSRRAAYDATVTTAAPTTLGATATIIAIGGNGAQTPPNGIISRVCVDPSENRCR